MHILPKAALRYKVAKAAGKITEEPVIFDKRFNNMGQIVESYVKHYKCGT